MSTRFSPFTLRGLALPNRIVVAPMCQYSADDGAATARRQQDNTQPIRAHPGKGAMP